MNTTIGRVFSVWVGLCAGVVLMGCGGGSTAILAAVPLPATQPVPAPEADDCFTDTKAGRQSLECEGLELELSVPAACLATACGLIVDVHGFGMTGVLEDMHTELGEIAGTQGFIVLQPSAPVSDSGFPSWSGSNDVQVLALINRLKSVFHVMDARVHMTGYSQGGFMTWRFLCDRPELFGSVAPLAAGSGTCFGGQQPAEQVDVFYGHGTTDGLVAFAGATTTVERILDRWDMSESAIVSQDDEHLWTRYGNDADTVFEFVRFDWETDFVLPPSPLLGHCFPGSGDFLGCGSDTAFHWGEEVTRFFLRHPRD